MLDVQVSYNPYLVQADIRINGNPLKEENPFFERCKNKRLTMWFDGFLENIVEEYREREINLSVHCTPQDAEDVRDSVKNFNKEHQESITLSIAEGRESVDDKIDRLKSLLKKAQTGPFKEFQSKELRQQFEEALKPDFEVNVIATMSSGKSTVINAMLGQELMPAKNEACTATIARIEDCDGMTEFEGQRKDVQGAVLEEWVPVDQDTLTKWNDATDTALIELKGNVESIVETQCAKLILVDTPGPNNARDKNHRKTTVEAITRKPLSMVLYVLNSTQMNINDDESLLNLVSDAMQTGGRQAQDRFVFIANKIDAFDPEQGESVTSALENARNYLQENGIENPMIVPASAELAKLARIQKKGKDLTRSQKNNLHTYTELFVEEQEMNMVEHSKGFLPSRCHDSLVRKIKSAQTDTEKAEILSGIPIVEELLNEFIKKHAIPAKIKDAVDTFAHVMARAEGVERVTEQLQKNEEELKESVQQLEKFEQSKERIDMAKSFRQKIKNKKYVPSKDLKDRYKKIHTEMLRFLEDTTELFGDQPERQKAERIIDRVDLCAERKMMDITTVIGEALQKDFLTGLEELRTEYEQNVQDILKKSFPKEDNNGLREFQAEALRMPEVSSMIQANIEEKKILVGSHEESDSKWYNPFTWGRKKIVHDYEYKDVVNMGPIWDEFNSSLRQSVQETIDKANKQAEDQAEEGKRMVLKAMDDIDRVWQENLENMRRASEDKEEAKKQIEENRQLIAWYEKFKQELNEVLAI